MTSDEFDSWLQERREANQPPLPEIEDAPKAEVERVTVDEIILGRIEALSKCSFQVASFDKRFVRDMQSVKLGDSLTKRQADYIGKLIYKYRRQIGVRP